MVVNFPIFFFSLFLPQVFDQQGVHLTPDAGKSFVEAIMYYADELFNVRETVDLEMEDVARQPTAGLRDESGPIASTSATRTVTERTIPEQFAEIWTEIRQRQHNDSMVLARVREELDFISNGKKEDRLLVIGLTSSERRPDGLAEGKKWLQDIVGAALNRLIQGSNEKIQFVNPVRGAEGFQNLENNELPVCEVKMKEREWALKVRKEFGKQKKEGKVEGKFFVANVVTLATKVRLEILRAIGRKCGNTREDMFAIGFTSRPVLQIRQKTGGAQVALTFVDAIGRLGARMVEADFAFAYARAGASFKGQMQQNFVVLTENGVREGARGRGNGRGNGRPALTGGNKRGWEDEGRGGNHGKRATGRGRGAPGHNKID